MGYLNNNQNGFTLVEVIVAIGISVLIVGSITAIFLFSIKSNKIVWEQLSTQNEGRKAVQDFTNELRTATASSVGAYPISSALDNQIIFYTKEHNSSLRNRIRYFLENNTLKKGVIAPSGNPPQYVESSESITDIVHDISNDAVPVFTYFDQNYQGGSGSPLSEPVDVTKIRMVKMSLNLEEDPNASPEPFHIETKVEIRNLKTN